MKIFSIIFVICLLQHVHLKLVAKTDLSRFFNCVENITSISTIAYNRKNPQGVANVNEQDTCSYIGDDKKVVFIVHGFMSTPTEDHFYDLASQLVQNNYTAFSVDWAKGACYLPCQYVIAVNNTRNVGKLMANYITHINSTCGVPLKNIILIGHSLGAHICGFAAKTIQTLGVGTISRLFGADPAGPFFEYNECKDRLCKTDAEHVIVLHTSFWGITKSIGHLDLYFNDKLSQPGCGWLEMIHCAHTRAVIYLTILLERSDCGFPGVPKLEEFDESLRPTNQSTNCIFVDKKIFEQTNITPGAYTVFVNNESPYCSPNTFSNCQQ